MFVSEGSIFNPCCVKVKICTLEGVSALLELDAELAIDALKIEAVSQLYDPSESTKLSLYYNILNIRTGRIIGEDQTLRQAEVRDNDELLLIKRRLPAPSLPVHKKEDISAPPSVDDINKATACVTLVNDDRKQLEPVITVDFHTELKRILVSLIDVAQKLVCLSPDNLEDAKKYVFLESLSCVNDVRTCSIDQNALEQLIEMGFDRAKASKALLVNRMSQMRAIQWLCDSAAESDSDISEVELSSQPSPVPVTDPSQKRNIETMEEETVRQELVELTKMSGASKVRRMLQAFKAYKRRVFKPDPGALHSLLEMGFDEPDAIDALRMYNNMKDDACDWLLTRSTADRASTNDVESAIEEGLDPDSSIYKAIMSSHIIQLSLTSHKTLIALLHILENPSTMQQWLRDADLSPMLLQISRIYHAEKYGQ